MKFLIVSHVEHHYDGFNYCAYGPYIKEMNIWEKQIEKLIVVAPVSKRYPGKIDLPYQSLEIDFRPVPAFNVMGLKNLFFSLFKLPIILLKVFLAMSSADHIHLRCPGNMGLIGAIAQIVFPKKRKTAKYAGNWDWSSKQPWSYRLQRLILRNTFLTKNMTVLVYGDWNETKNIKPFFTASYSEKEIIDTPPRIVDLEKSLRLIYVGGLQEGKRPMLGLEVLSALIQKGISVQMHFYGEGPERPKMEKYINDNKLHKNALLHGNVEAQVIKEAFQKSHFLIFISRSEGWPKVVAESMFWGCFPLTSSVSCVPEMIGNGARGELILPDSKAVAERVSYFLHHPNEYKRKCLNAMEWSRIYTLDYFESQIKDILFKPDHNRKK